MFSTRGSFPYFIELAGLPAFLAAFVLLLAFPFALIAVAVLAVAALAGVVTLVAGLFAAPVLLVRAVYRRWTSREEQPHSEPADDEVAYPAHATLSGAA
jgi:membrane protein implicated in regulation of membrane protease activity